MEKLKKIALIITSINKPTEAIKKYYSLSKKNKVNFIIIGDKKTPKYPKKYNFYDLKSQKNFKFTLNKSLPINYSLRNYKQYSYSFLHFKPKSVLIFYHN